MNLISNQIGYFSEIFAENLQDFCKSAVLCYAFYHEMLYNYFC